MFRKILVLFGMIGVLLSCNEQKPKEYIPKYDKFTNDLERENLIGKVKRVVHSKKKYRFYEFEDKTNDLILSDIDYNIYGNMVKAIYFNDAGQIDKRITIKNSENQRIRYWIEFYPDSNKYRYKLEKNDALGNRLYAQGYFRGKWWKVENTYDSLNNIIKVYDNSNLDNNILAKYNLLYYTKQYKNFYNSNGQLNKRIEYDTNWYGEPSKTVDNYSYDMNGRIVEIETIIGNYLRNGIINVYDNKGIKVKYTASHWGESDSVIEYNKYSDPVKMIYPHKYHQSVTCQQKMLEKKYEYVYDYYGNWVVKKIYTNEGMNNGGYWLKDIENRKIEYYK